MIVYRLFNSSGKYDYLIVSKLGPYYCIDCYWKFETLGM